MSPGPDLATARTMVLACAASTPDQALRQRLEERIAACRRRDRAWRWRRPDCVAGHIGLELANVALTRRDLNRSLPGVREKSLVRKCCVNPRSSAEITKNRHFRVRVLSPQPRSQVSTSQYANAASPPRSLGLLAFRPDPAGRTGAASMRKTNLTAGII